MKQAKKSLFGVAAFFMSSSIVYYIGSWLDCCRRIYNSRSGIDVDALSHRESHHIINGRYPSNQAGQMGQLDGMKPIAGQLLFLKLLRTFLHNNSKIPSFDHRVLKNDISSIEKSIFYGLLPKVMRGFFLHRDIAQLNEGDHIHIPSHFPWDQEVMASHAVSFVIIRRKNDYLFYFVDTISYGEIDLNTFSSDSEFPDAIRRRPHLLVNSTRRRPYTVIVPLSAFDPTDKEQSQKSRAGLKQLLSLGKDRFEAYGKIYEIPLKAWNGKEITSSRSYRLQRTGTCTSTSKQKALGLLLSEKTKHSLGLERAHIVEKSAHRRSNPIEQILYDCSKSKIASSPKKTSLSCKEN